METLSELVKLITQKRVKKVELFDEENRTKNSHYFKLFEGIHHRKYTNDQDASQDIYACDANEKKYLILKTRLKQKMLNTLFFVDIQANTEVTEKNVAEYECRKNLYQIQMLFLQKAFNTALSILEKTKKKAQYYQLTAVELEITQLYGQYFVEKQHPKEYQQNSQHVLSILEKYQKEIQTKVWLEEIQLLYTKNKMEDKQLLQHINTNLPQAKIFLDKFPTFELYENVAKYEVLKAEIEHRTETMLENLSSLEKNYQQHPHFFSHAKMYDLQLQKLKAYLKAKDFEQGIAYIEVIKQHLDDFSFEQTNLFYQLKFLLAMHNHSYQYAWQTLEEVAELPYFKYLDKYQKHIYIVFWAYIKYLHKVQKIQELKNLPSIAKIGEKIQDFLQAEIMFEKSERGTNIAHLVVKMLFCIQQNEWEICRDIITQLLAYTRRYPKPDANYRSECFIIMLKAMQEADFKYYPTKKNAEKYFILLQLTYIDHRNYEKNVEVLPYEWIWERILSHLKSR